ncbi:MAG: hypothetical protein M1832_006052 [Thelocarpon impressellum]|nr:MAG: hypothetical protein M1832_006052 [Thelocarpon impressellum]
MAPVNGISPASASATAASSSSRLGRIPVARAMLVPFPTEGSTVEARSSREEKLERIIKNLGEHHKRVRKNVLASARVTRRNLDRRSARAPNGVHPRTPAHQDQRLQTRHERTEQVLSFLRSSPSSTPPPEPVDEHTPATENRYTPLLQTTTSTLEAYDAHAALNRAYYRDALARMARGHRFPALSPTRTSPPPPRSPSPPRPPRQAAPAARQSPIAAALARPAEEAQLAALRWVEAARTQLWEGPGGQYDASRDPRVRRPAP